MRVFHVFLVFSGIFLLASACDDGTKKKKKTVEPSLEQSSITAGPVVYKADLAGLLADITVHVVDEQGNAMPGVTVMPASDREADVFEPVFARTDAAGNAVFSIRGDLGTAQVSAFVSTAETVDVSKDPLLAARADVNFDVSIQVVPLEAAYSWDMGDFTLRATFSDGAGPIAAASAAVSTSDPDLRFEQGATSLQVQTNASGSATFHAFSPKAGMLPLSFQLEGVSPKTVNVALDGPSVGGTAYLGQRYPAAFVSARAAAMALNMISRTQFDGETPLLGELTSESVCPCPEPSAFQLRLPIMPPDSMLVSDPVRQIRYNYFPIVLYDDLDNDHVWSSPETLLGARMTGGVLYYARPDGANPSGPLGWSLVSTFADEPQVLDWEFFQNSLDTFIRRSPIEQVKLHGTIPASFAGDRILVAMVNSLAMGNYTPPYAWTASGFERLQPSDVMVLLDDPAPEGTDVEFDLTLDAPTLTEEHREVWRVPWLSPQGNQADGYLVVAFHYADENGNGAYDSGDTLKGVLRLGDPGTTPVIFYIEKCNNYEVLYQPETIGVHLGYTLIQTNLAPEIQTVDFDFGAYTFNLRYILPVSFSDTPFSIVHGFMLSAPVATGTFSQSEGNYIISLPAVDCQNCNQAASGDRFVFLQPYSSPMFEILDWMDLNFTTGVP